MIFPGQRGFRGGRWVANEQLIEEDINFTTELLYTNLTALLGTLTRPDVYGEDSDIVLGGLTLVHNNLLTCDFSAGIAYSYSGYYLTGGTWGFVASSGNLFTVVQPVSQSVAFLSGGANARIDLLEVRPVRTAYDSQTRQFKDPITGLVTGGPLNTKYEYGYAFQIIKGDDTAALTKEQTTWQIGSATVGSDVAGKYVLFSTRSADYYIWYDTGASSDPAVSGRTGIEVSVNAGDDDDAIALATRTALSAHQLTTDGEIVVTGATNQFIITLGFYVNITDSTNGDMSTYFDAISITQGNGVPDHTAGWIKIAEVAVGASASSITQSDILDVRDSDQWENEPLGTRFRRWPADEITITDTLSRFTGIEVETVLTEVPTFTELISTVNGKGASLVGVEGLGAGFDGTDVEAVLKEIHRKRGIMAAGNWAIGTAPNANLWQSAAYSPSLQLFVMVASTGVTYRAGSAIYAAGTWTERVVPADEDWQAVCWSDDLAIFCAVSSIAGGENGVMISSNGTSWTIQSASSLGSWSDVIWVSDLTLFIAVKSSGVMTSVNGTAWSDQTAASGSWKSVAWSPELTLAVAVASSGTYRAMTSPDGINWTGQAGASAKVWNSVAWSPTLGLFAACSSTSSIRQIITSPDGVNWTDQSTPRIASWVSITWAEELGLFVAIASASGSEGVAMISSDGINWEQKGYLSLNGAQEIIWSPEVGIFVAPMGLGGVATTIVQY